MRRQLDKSRKIVVFIVMLTSLFCLESILFAATGPKIKFDKESWNFGKAEHGKVLTHVFKFNNEGDSPLIIKKIRTSCGCTAALVSAKKIDPGKRGEIKVTFNTRGYAGKVNMFVYIDLNDPTQPQTQLMLSADIEFPPSPKIDLNKSSFDMGLLLEGEDISESVKFRNSGDRELSMEFSHRDAIFSHGDKKISSAFTIPAGKEAVIEIKIPSRKRPGLIREYILIKSNDPARPSLSLALSGYVITKKQLKELFIKYKDILINKK